jgi:putative tryptophan/tyrosine transport system substrate-binding protein
MNRRELITIGMAALAWPSCANAQVPRKIPKIGMLWHAGSAEEEGAYFTSLIEGFKALGYVEGQTILFEHRYAHEQYERFAAIAQELVGLKVDVIMASILPAARAAKQATDTIPVVFVIVSDPVGTGLAESLAHPGGNLTGMSNVSEDLTAKRVQTFKDTVPKLKRMGLIVHPGGQSPRPGCLTNIAPPRPFWASKRSYSKRARLPSSILPWTTRRLNASTRSQRPRFNDLQFTGAACRPGD